MILCRGRNAQRQASIFLLPQPVTASIPALDVLSVGSESELVLQFNLLCLFQSLFPFANTSTHPSLYIYSAVLSPFPPQRLAPFAPSLSLSLSQPFLLPPLLFIFPHLLHPCRHRGSSPSRGTVIRTGRELAVRQTNSELGHHCLCVRGPLSR